MKIAIYFSLATLLLGCGSEQSPAPHDATIGDTDVTDASDVSMDASDAGVPGDTNPLHDMDTR